jgi:hypothetical protein
VLDLGKAVLDNLILDASHRERLPGGLQVPLSRLRCGLECNDANAQKRSPGEIVSNALLKKKRRDFMAYPEKKRRKARRDRAERPT